MTTLKLATSKQVSELLESDAYPEYIMKHCAGDRLIGNGEMLIDAQESQYLFEEFLASLGLTEEL